MSANIEGLSKLNGAIGKLVAKYGKSARVTVGYTQNYALFVDQDRQAHHENGRAGFLSDTAREGQAEYARIIRDGIKAGLTLEQAVLRAGLQLQADSQAACPVDTGALRASAFTRLEPS